jgi:tetratricopeptide (TPR) repeat protein
MEPNNSAMLQAMGFVQRRQGNWEEAYKNLKHALELNPASLDLIGNVINTALYMRRYDDADRFIEQGTEMAPDYAPFRVYVAMRLMLYPGDLETAKLVMNNVAREFGPAATSSFIINLDLLMGNYRDILDLLPNLPEMTRFFGVADSANYYLLKGVAYDLLTGLDTVSDSATVYYDSARVAWENQLNRRPDDAMTYSQLGFAYAGLRNKEKAYEYSKRATELMPLSRDALTGGNVLESLAMVKGLFGDNEEAIEILKILLDIPSFVTPGTLKHHPLFAPLKSDPQFQKLLEKKKTL